MSPTKRKTPEVLDEQSREQLQGPSTKRRVEGTPNQGAKPNPVHELSYPSTGPSAAPAPAVPFQQPAPLLTFSYTPARELEFADCALRYYVPAPLGADLRYGYERWTRRPEEKGRVDGLLRAVARVRARMERAEGGSGRAWLEGVGVVAWRGVMTKILTAPYEERDGWEMNVMDVGGTLYFEEHLSDARLRDKEDMAPHHRLQSYYGYSFEAWSTSSRPGVRERLEGHPEGWGGDVDTNVQWCCVAKTKLGDTRLVIGGEVDCARERFMGKTSDLVELKTSMVIRNAQDEARFEKKLLKFYFQSFLLGVPEIIVGFRAPSGQLSTLQSFKTMQIPRLVRGKPGAWDPVVCFDWANRFIQFLNSVLRNPNVDGTISKATAREDPPYVWRVTFRPREGVNVKLLEEERVQEVEAGEDRVGFLPKWYLDEIRSRAAVLPAQAVGGSTNGLGSSNASDGRSEEGQRAAPPGGPSLAGWIT